MALSCGGARAVLLHVAAAAVALACVAAGRAAAQGTTDTGGVGEAVPSCVSNLVPCGGYLNTTATPSPSCCGPLREAADTEAACMCSILMNRAALQAFGVAPEQALLLAKRCGVTVDASTCAKYTSAAGAGAAVGSTAASSASTGNAAATVAKPMASGAAAHRLSLTAAASMVVGFSFIWWMIAA